MFAVSYGLHSNQSITSVLHDIFQWHSICLEENEALRPKYMFFMDLRELNKAKFNLTHERAILETIQTAESKTKSLL